MIVYYWSRGPVMTVSMFMPFGVSVQVFVVTEDSVTAFTLKSKGMS